MKSIEIPGLYYSHCWEDADLLLRGLQPAPGSSVLSIGSAGDNSFSLLSADPSSVLVVDYNPVQIHLIQLKKSAFRILDYEDLKAFLGFTPCTDRLRLYRALGKDLPAGSKEFWKNHLTVLEKGICGTGKLENYFRFYRKRILPLIAGTSLIEQFFDGPSDQEQIGAYILRYRQRRIRFLLKLFFSKWIMAQFGRTSKHFGQVDRHVGTHFYEKIRSYLENPEAYRNFYIRHISMGDWKEELPHYIREENYTLIRERLDRMELYGGSLLEALGENRKFHSMNLSNVFEYMSPEELKDHSEPLASCLEPGARLCSWNLMVKRRLSELLPGQLEYLEQRSGELGASDRIFFYDRFILEKALDHE